ncbi:NAD(P)-dependent alcohol dehydrogenase [Rubripirellula lacrimiformis]|uniref:NAD(P)-dependent alcohol dehydrogenase n=1 Tax=Rubripirellula lacrimiformis TaxID=1930273 RepID=UPI001FE35033|nr:NAD(P)-dependent alcohol dehydrogenase [Rubripirellula lacrimiformis]
MFHFPGWVTVRAIYQQEYGSPQTLALTELERPSIRRDEVRICVHAAGLHIGDAFAVRGTPFLMRMETGWRRPRYGVPGFDVAGVVESVGANVKQWKPGDAVFGACKGSCAELVSAKQDHIAAKPNNLTYAQAAALPTSGLAALHALRNVARVTAGQKVLINGASGGVGTYAVQIAKAFGAGVTGVCSDRNAGLVRSIGADHVIAYDHSDFAAGQQRYDVILDNVENRSLHDCRRVLAPSGILILNSGTGASGLSLLWRIAKPLLLSPFSRQRLRRYLSMPNRKDLETLTSLIDAGSLSPVIDRCYTLDETASAVQHLEAGHARGKVVVLVQSDSETAGTEP